MAIDKAKVHEAWEHQEAGRFDQAAAIYEKQLRRCRGNAEETDALRPLLFDSLERAGRYYKCAKHIQAFLKTDPNDSRLWTCLSSIETKLGNHLGAVSACKKALELNPGDLNARWNLALAYLALGDMKKGFSEYVKCPRALDVPRKPGPQWEGQPLNGKTILIYTEQGLGDALQFIRYMPMVKARGGRLLLECQPELVRLFRGIKEIDGIYPRGSPLPPYDFQSPLISLAHIFGTTAETIPGGVRYLSAESGLVEQWRDRMSVFTGRKVGLCWRGDPVHVDDKWRSIPLKYFDGLLNDPTPTFISLHKGPGEGDIQKCGFADRIVNYIPEVRSFADTAAIVENLDLIITADTAVAHLAGALGRPTWVLLKFAPDCRWMMGRDDVSWYPSMRLFRQRNSGDWADVLARVESAFSQR